MELAQGCLDPAKGWGWGDPLRCEKSRGGSSALLPPPGRTRGVAGEAPDNGSECESEGSWKGIIHDGRALTWVQILAHHLVTGCLRQ